MLEFIIFGFIDNFVMIIGAFTGLSVESKLPKPFQKGLGTIIGAGLGNAFSDFLGGLGATNLSLAFGSLVGCLVALIFIPLFNYCKNTIKHHS